MNKELSLRSHIKVLQVSLAISLILLALTTALFIRKFNEVEEYAVSRDCNYQSYSASSAVRYLPIEY